MNNYIIIKTNDGILKFEGDLLNCDIDNTSVYDTNKTTLATFTINKSIKIEAEIIPTTDVEIPNNIQDVFAENRQLREVNAQLRALLESQE